MVRPVGKRALRWTECSPQRLMRWRARMCLPWRCLSAVMVEQRPCLGLLQAWARRRLTQVVRYWSRLPFQYTLARPVLMPRQWRAFAEAVVLETGAVLWPCNNDSGMKKSDHSVSLSRRWRA